LISTLSTLEFEAIRVAHCVPSLDPAAGGPSRSVVSLANAMIESGSALVEVISQSLANSVPYIAGIPKSAITIATCPSAFVLSMGLPLKSALNMRVRDPAQIPSIVHSHGIWHSVSFWATSVARKSGIPFICHPRGMLEPWALQQKSLKKRLAYHVYQRRHLDGAAALIATSVMEAESIRRLKLNSPVAIIPNGVSFPPPELVLNVRQKSQRTRTALFISRIHPKKGLQELIHAWAAVMPVGWRLRIAGPDEGGHWFEVAKLIEDLGLSSCVEYFGLIEGEQKEMLYRQADLFVLPTFSENFGLVIAEALSYGVPVITTRGAPWADLEVYRCGWWIDTGVSALVEALRFATGLSNFELEAMGERGRSYVQRYNWETVAKETVAVYRWVLGRGERPACVHLV
jgi:glycosyltransferase involved in cell wall biosynthesis